MRNVRSLSAAGLALVVAVGCGSSDARTGFGSDRSPTDPALGSSGGLGGTPANGLVLAPLNATAIIDTAASPVVPGSVVYKLSKQGQDLTGAAQFSLSDSSIGAFSGATFTSIMSLPTGVLGRSATVQAKTPEGEALGTLTVVALRNSGDQRDFFFVVPYNDNPTPKSDVLKFSTNIKQADVAFVMDTTGSMTPSIGALKSALSGTLLAQLQAAIPNVGMAVVDYKDFGNFDPWSVMVRQVVTTSLSAAQSAVNAMTASGGGDDPEAQVGAMYFALTGQANSGSPSVAAHTAPAGTFGGVNFRTGSVPIVVDISDATWHDPSGNTSIAGLKTAFSSAKAKFVQVTEGVGSESQPNDLSDATGSHVSPSAFGSVAGCASGQCCTGVNGNGRAPTGPGGTCRLNFLSSNGNGVSSGIVKAISAIAVGTTFDVKATASNDPKNANKVDATKFIKALRAMDEGDASQGCPVASAKDSDGDGIKDTFVAVNAGTPVCFEVVAATNTTVPPALDPQFFNAFIDVMGLPGDLKLDTRSVLFLVPPQTAGVK